MTNSEATPKPIDPSTPEAHILSLQASKEALVGVEGNTVTFINTAAEKAKSAHDRAIILAVGRGIQQIIKDTYDVTDETEKNIAEHGLPAAMEWLRSKAVNRMLGMDTPPLAAAPTE